MAEIKKDMENRVLFESMGQRIVEAVKLPVLTIGLGPVGALRDLKGFIWRNDNGNVIIRTKEEPKGASYDQNWIAVVRLINGISESGQYDLYAVSPEKAARLLSNPVHLKEAQKEELQPVLNAGSEISASLAPSEDRKVIIIGEEQIGEEGFILCHASYNEEGVKTKLLCGDVFVVEDEENYKGYRIGSDEFRKTHILK